MYYCVEEVNPTLPRTQHNLVSRFWILLILSQHSQCLNLGLRMGFSIHVTEVLFEKPENIRRFEIIILTEWYSEF